MYKVLIVDDEEPVLESFSLIVTRDARDFELCGTARSGYEAIDLCDDLKPDVVFMDIQMPGIDGIETIRQIRQQYPGTVFILATAYERFDIAQEAIRLGIFSYLVKPVSRKTFLDELEKVRQLLDKRKENRSRSLSKAGRSQDEQDRLEQLVLIRLSRAVLEKEEWDEFKRNGGFHADRAAFYIVEGGDGEMRLALKNKMNYRYRCFSASIGRRQLLLFPEEQNLDGVFLYLKSVLEEQGAEPTSLIGNGGIYPYDEMAHSFREALEPFRAELNSSARSWEMEQLEELRGNLRRGEKSPFADGYKDYWIHLLSRYDFPVARAKLIEAFTLFWETLDWYGSPDELPEEFSAVEEIAVLNSELEWEQWSSVGLNRLLANIAEQKTDELPPPLQKAISYIHSHYSEPIYLGSVADACSISTGYLSHLFSEQMDTTFVNYLNRYRIDRAEELLKEKKLSIKEVAYRTGYQDPNYFSRIFRKIKNLSPSEV